MADLSGDRRGLIPAYNPANQLNPCFRQNVSRKLLLTSIAVTHLAFLEQSLVAVRKRSEKSSASEAPARHSRMPVVQTKLHEARIRKAPKQRCARTELH